MSAQLMINMSVALIFTEDDGAFMSRSWRDELIPVMPRAWADEIDEFSTQMELRRQGKVDEKVFAELRLRRGVYGQRYDNGQRHDGVRQQTLAYPSGQLTKGPSTLWDAPGMQRIKIPYGRLKAAQLLCLAELAEEYADGIAHITTRQDIQLHFVHIEDTPDLMRRLAAVGLTTREACGNSVRNVTACPRAGVCHDEGFDVTSHAHALAFYLLGHPDAQDFGRKFKVAFSGCAQHACGLAHMHDIGVVAAVRGQADRRERGFSFYVGGGLGAVPHKAKLLYDFVPEAELLPVALAVCRVFTRLGERKNRARARLKFVVAKVGVDAFRREVERERDLLVDDPRWTAHLTHFAAHDDVPQSPPASLGPGPYPSGFSPWRVSNVRPQRQQGYATAEVHVPLGDLTSAQLRALADICNDVTGDTLRTTVEQNVLFRWVPEAELPRVYRALSAAGLAAAGAGTIADVTACPGTDTCKLGISSSRGLAAVLSEELSRTEPDPAVRDLRVKVSGCFNACGQHHIADLGFLGVSRKVAGYTVPHFQVVLGGQWSENAGSFGLALGAVPSKRIPEVVRRITGRYVHEREEGETFQGFVRRIGKAAIKESLEDLVKMPSHTEDPSLYSDWSDPRQYSIADMGVGECAGEVVSPAEFGLAQSEQQVFEAQLCLDNGDCQRAAELAYGAMLQAARALLLAKRTATPDAADALVQGFREHLCDSGLFDQGGQRFSSYLFSAHTSGSSDLSDELAHQRVEEALLFIEAAHACHARLAEA